MKPGIRNRGSALDRRGGMLLAGTLAALLAGCSVLGGGNGKDAPTIYAPDPRVAADPSWPTVRWQLSLSQPVAARTLDSFRIAVRPVPGELQVYKGVSWAKPPSDMLLDTVLRALEDSGRIPAVARQGSGVAADYKLIMDVRRFDADYAGNAVPSATIEVNAKLLHAVDQNIVAARTFLHAEPAASVDVGQVSEAFSRSLGVLGGEIAGWVLSTGETHEREAHRSGKR